MKMPKEFIKVYDMVFNWILVHEGLGGLISFWKALAPVILPDLKEKAKEGIYGCWQYWNKVLTEEGAKFHINIYPELTAPAGWRKLKLYITECPSIKILNIPLCPEYCRHCGVIYPEILENMGFKYTWKRTGSGRCEIEVEKI